MRLISLAGKFDVGFALSNFRDASAHSTSTRVYLFGLLKIALVHSRSITSTLKLIRAMIYSTKSLVLVIN
jgi:hypothetical protein